MRPNKQQTTKNSQVVAVWTANHQLLTSMFYETKNRIVIQAACQKLYWFVL